MFYDANEKIDDPFAPLPSGRYKLVVEDAKYGHTQKGDGMMMKVTLVVADAQYRGRKIWTHFNVRNPNIQAQNIGKAEMRRFLEALGVTKSLATPEDFSRAVTGRSVLGDLEVEGKFNRVIGFERVLIDASAENRAKASNLDDIPF